MGFNYLLFTSIILLILSIIFNYDDPNFQAFFNDFLLFFMKISENSRTFSAIHFKTVNLNKAKLTFSFKAHKIIFRRLPKQHLCRSRDV